VPERGSPKTDESKPIYHNYYFAFRTRNAIGRQVQQIQLQQPQFVQVEVADVDNQQFIVYAD
jgi:hypothetical protein